MTLPMPYDPVYLANWFAFVKQLSDRYRDRPEFLMIAADGPTSVSEEFTEPRSAADITKWLAHHYTVTKYLEAWQTTFETYAKLFTNQYISMSHGYGLPINAEGVFDPRQASRTPEEVVGQAWSTLGAQFAFQSSALTGTTHMARAIEMVRSYNGLAVTGFLLATNIENQTEYMGAAGNAPLALTRTIENGMQLNPITGRHADYIEVHAVDVDEENLQPVLRWGASLFE
jgi:hypothetical protein